MPTMEERTKNTAEPEIPNRKLAYSIIPLQPRVEQGEREKGALF